MKRSRAKEEVKLPDEDRMLVDLLGKLDPALMTKLVQSEKCRALRFGGFDAAPIAALESDATVTLGPPSDAAPG